MKFIIAFTFLLFIAMAGFSQGHFTITGIVTDKNTGLPLAGASVFAQNTTFGVATDQDGKFRLKIPDGGYELVVSFSGYVTETMRISSTTASGDDITISMSPKEKSLEEVNIVISNEIKNGWEKYGAFFIENFIGKSDFSKQALIRNPEVLKFYYSKKRNRLKVNASAPLVVANDALGYTIHFAIDSFTYDYNTNFSQFIGYPLFEEMTGTPEKIALWQQNRLIAYQGSELHFMRSFYNRTLAEEGFELQFLVRDHGTDQVIPIKDKNIYPALHYEKDDSLNTVDFRPNQPDMIVLYKNAGPQQAYLDFDPTAKTAFQVSTVNVAPGEIITIEKNGYFYNQSDLTINGYWGFQKVGDMLPYDYQPQ